MQQVFEQVWLAIFQAPKNGQRQQRGNELVPKVTTSPVHRAKFASVLVLHHQGLNAVHAVPGRKQNLSEELEAVSLVHLAIHAIDVLVVEAQGAENVRSSFHLLELRGAKRKFVPGSLFLGCLLCVRLLWSLGVFRNGLGWTWWSKRKLRRWSPTAIPIQDYVRNAPGEALIDKAASMPRGIASVVQTGGGSDHQGCAALLVDQPRMCLQRQQSFGRLMSAQPRCEVQRGQS
mmetsp:Transcript_67740/g.158900  ORF Transcript_67740/g.158900 Transcript_67740/m.158900 type:complete len:232 (+) Transcript_67740:2348-3043(+)